MLKYDRMSLSSEYIVQIEMALGARVVKKDQSKLMKWIGKIVEIWDPTFMEDSATTIGRTIAIPAKWFIDDDTLYVTLRHEAQHVRDWNRYGPLMSLSYLGPIPVGPLNLRWVWEYRAYVEGLRASYEIYQEISNEDLDWIADQFVSSMYLWMLWPFRSLLRKHLNKVREEITHENKR
jgi:hypothetical protein